MTAIEQLVAALPSAALAPSDVLVPEHCALVYEADGSPVHITAQFVLDTDDSLRSFYRSFPIVTAYIDQEYRQAATHVFDDRFGISLYVRKDRMPTGTWEPLGWPCYGTGTNVAHSQMMFSNRAS